MPDLIESVLREVERLGDELVTLCRDLVRINTVNPYAGAGLTGLEGAGQDHLEPIMKRLGATTHRFEPPADVYRRVGMLGPRDRCWKGRPNLVSTFALGDGPRIVVNSHMDTVGVAGMSGNPFSAELRDGTIYGRGSSDDKGGMAIGVIAIQALLAHADRLGGTIVHQSVVDEECNGGGAGTIACILEGYTGDEAFVIDGGGLDIMRGCLGVLTADLLIAGRAGHAAHGGISAIDKAVRLKLAIDDFKKQRESRYPQCLVNLGIFHAGVHPAVVPGNARLSLNLVYHLAEAAAGEAAGRGWNGAAIRDDFEAAIRQAEAGDDWQRQHPATIEWVKDLIPFETPADSPLVTGLADAWRRVRPGDPTVAIMDAWADAANLTRYGNTPAVLFGPGTPGKAHGDDETVQVQDLIDGAKILAAALASRLAKR